MFQRILIPVDLENIEFADKAMKAAIIQAKQFNAHIHVISVMPGFGMSLVGNYFPEDAMKKARHEVSQKLADYVEKTIPDDIPCSCEVLQGKPHKGILKAAKDTNADLIVIPSHNYKRMEKALLGSCTSRVVQQSTISVMVVKPG